MFQESINIHEKQSPFKTILIVIFIITTIIFLILFINEKKKNQLLTKNTSLYKPDINNYKNISTNIRIFMWMFISNNVIILFKQN